MEAGLGSSPTCQKPCPGPFLISSVPFCSSQRRLSFWGRLACCPCLRHSSLGGLGSPFFCLTTTTEMVTRLVITCLTCRSTLTCLLFALKKATQKGSFCWFWLIWADTSHMVCFLAFLAAYPLCTIHTIDVHNAISNMLQFKPHLVLCFNRAYEAFPAIYLDTFSMLIWIQFHRMCHSKEENSKQVG